MEVERVLVNFNNAKYIANTVRNKTSIYAIVATLFRKLSLEHQDFCVMASGSVLDFNKTPTELRLNKFDLATGKGSVDIQFMDATMQVYVKTLTGKTLIIGCDQEETIYSLMQRIQKKEGIPPEQQRIIYAGKQLNASDTLSSYNVTNESVCHLVLRLSGGMYQPISGRNGDYNVLDENVFDVEPDL
jgi:hypothetical protein